MSRRKVMIPYPVHHMEVPLQTGERVTLEMYLTMGLRQVLLDAAVARGGKRRASKEAVRMGIELLARRMAERALCVVENDYLMASYDLVEKRCDLLEDIEALGASWIKRMAEAGHAA
jgi:hypothetical protein